MQRCWCILRRCCALAGDRNCPLCLRRDPDHGAGSSAGAGNTGTGTGSGRACPGRPGIGGQLQEGFVHGYPAANWLVVPAMVSVTSIVHKAEQTTLERPAFLSKDGLTAAEMGHGSARFSGTCGLCLCCCQSGGHAGGSHPCRASAAGDHPAGGPEIAENSMQAASAALPRAKPLQRSAQPKVTAGAGLHHGAARVGRAGRHRSFRAGLPPCRAHGALRQAGPAPGLHQR